MTPSASNGGQPRRLHLLLVLVAAHRGGAVQAGGKNGEVQRETAKLMRSESEDSSREHAAHQRAGLAASVEATGSVLLAANASDAQHQTPDCQPCSEVKSLVGTKASPVLSDSSISFSSCWDPSNDVHGQGAPWRVRLDNDDTTWCAGFNDPNQWVSFRFGKKMLITKVVTKGRSNCCDQWVTRYDVYGDDKRVGGYDANADARTEVAREMSPAFAASEVKIAPQGWNNHISMRADVLGCECVPVTTTTTTTTSTTTTTTTTSTTTQATTMSAKSGATWLRAGSGPLVVALLALAGALAP